MTSESAHDVGSICHIEIPAKDLPKAKAFYSSVFTWEIQENVPGPSYWFFRAADARGAFDPEAEPSEHGVLLVLRVDDIPSKLAEIEAAGGAVVTQKTAIGGGMGYYAYFRDPNGNKLGIWSAT